MARPAGADEIVALHREARHEEALAAIMEPLTRKDSRAADQTDQTAAAVRLLNELALASMNQRGAACFSFDAAFAYLRRAQKLLNVSPALKAVTLNNLSIYHSRTQQPHAAERCLQRALELIGGVARPHGAHADGDDISVHVCLNLTTVLADIGRHRDSLSMAQQAVKALGRQKKPSAGSTLPDATVQLASAAYYNLAVQQERLRTGNGGAGFAQSYRAAIAEAKRGGTVTQEAAWLAAAHAATHRPKTSTRLLKARPPSGLAARMPRRGARRARVPSQGRRLPLRLLMDHPGAAARPAWPWWTLSRRPMRRRWSVRRRCRRRRRRGRRPPRPARQARRQHPRQHPCTAHRPARAAPPLPARPCPRAAAAQRLAPASDSVASPRPRAHLSSAIVCSR